MPGEHQGVGHQKVPLQLRGRRRAADRRQGPRSAGVTGTYLDGVCKFSRGYFGSPEVCEWCMQIGFFGGLFGSHSHEDLLYTQYGYKWERS